MILVSGGKLSVLILRGYSVGMGLGRVNYGNARYEKEGMKMCDGYQLGRRHHLNELQRHVGCEMDYVDCDMRVRMRLFILPNYLTYEYSLLYLSHS